MTSRDLHGTSKLQDVSMIYNIYGCIDSDDSPQQPKLVDIRKSNRSYGIAVVVIFI